MTYIRRSDSGKQHLAWIKRQLLKHASANLSQHIDVSTIGRVIPDDLSEHEQHGLRSESLFQELVDALGRFAYLKQEDVGDWIDRGPSAQPVDYLIGDRFDRRLAVEVKNCHKVTGDFTIRSGDLARLQKYADIVGHSLRLAIHWSKWRLWTLVDPAFLVGDTDDATRRRVSLGDAMMYNEMAALGDALVHTRAPMGVRARITKIKGDRQAPTSESIIARIDAVEVFSGRRIVSSQDGRRIALHLLFYGTWRSEDWTLDRVDGIDYLVLRSAPPEGVESTASGWSPIGYLSTHFTNAVLADLPDGAARVEQGVGGFKHGDLGSIIPENFDFEGSDLPLMVFAQVPKHSPDAFNKL
jgi:hypothetical protein